MKTDWGHCRSHLLQSFYNVHQSLVMYLLHETQALSKLPDGVLCGHGCVNHLQLASSLWFCLGLPTHRKVLGLHYHDRKVHQSHSIFSSNRMHQRCHGFGTAHFTLFHLEGSPIAFATQDWSRPTINHWLPVSFRQRRIVLLLMRGRVCIVSIVRMTIVIDGMHSTPLDGTWGMVANFIWM